MSERLGHMSGIRAPRSDHDDPATGRTGGRALDDDDPASVPRVSWRTELLLGSGLNLLLGTWLVVAPFVLGYDAGDPTVSDIVAGSVVSTLAVVRLIGGGSFSAMSWANMVIGLWVLVSAFWLADSAAARWNEAIVGAAVTILAALSAWATDAARRASTNAATR